MAKHLVEVTKSDLEAFQSGRERRVVSPFPRGTIVAPGDTVVFVETTFDRHGQPTIVPIGATLEVVLTAASPRGEWADHHQDLICLEW